MGANVIHGRRLSKRRVRDTDGGESDELFAEEGDSVNMAYSSVARVVEFCNSYGVREDDWPIYYGISEGNVDLADVVARCERLRHALAGLREGEGAEIPWFASVREWLMRGEQFAVFE
jgi:hypothetical protein